MNETILIIANGPSILKNKFGYEIDKFDEVARINNYKTDNFSEYIGKKTTIWLNGTNKNLKCHKNPPKKIFVFVPYEILEKKEARVLERTPKRLKLKPNQYTLLDKEKMKYYEKISMIKRPTTGFNSILWAIENYKKVIIHGFDFFQDSKEHYYDSYISKKIANLKIMKKAEKHDNIAEKEFVENLLLNKKIIKLSSYIKDINHD